MDVVLDVLLLGVGILLLVGGGEVLVRGAVSLSKAVGVSTLLIGLTVVAFGTSAPELAVNVVAALKGNSDISFGNIIGSNIANIGLIVGLTALVRPLVCHKSVVVREMPIMLIATGAIVVMGLDRYVGTGEVNAVGRGDGGILLGMFVAFMLYMIALAMSQRKRMKLVAATEPSEPPAESADATVDEMVEAAEDASLVAEIEAEIEEVQPMPVGPAILFVLGGLVGVMLGGDLTVRGAIGIAEAAGISQAVIGLTIVAIGTSLPELVTSLMAVLRGHADIAVGNVVGSNIWNLLFIMGVTATVNPVDVPIDGGVGDLIMVTVLSILLFPMAITGGRTVARWEGAVVLVAYLAYMTWRTLVEMGQLPGLGI